jgi:hypothetical protein
MPPVVTIMTVTLPNVVHPKLVKVYGYTLRIVSFCKLTDEQALNAGILFVRTHKLKKSDRKKTLRVLTTFDERSSGML